MVNGEQSRAAMRVAKEKKRKAKRARRAKEKYGSDIVDDDDSEEDGMDPQIAFHLQDTTNSNNRHSS
jgi:hypothetical protein